MPYIVFSSSIITSFYSFNDDVVKIVDQAVENLDPSLWSSLKNKTAARDSSISTAEKLAQEALLKIGK